MQIAGGEPEYVPLNEDAGWKLDVEKIEKHLSRKTKVLLLCNPNNPTGTIYTREQLLELAKLAEKKDLYIITDEVYRDFLYTEDEYFSLAQLKKLHDRVIRVFSFSKAYAMTGWRIGWIVVPDHFIDLVEVLSQNLFIAASTISQHAALAAFAPTTLEILEQRRSEFRQRRDFLSKALTEIGFTVPVNTEGAFYIYAGIDKFSNDSELFCSQLLEQHGVAITPGTDFGEYRANQFVRFAFTTDMDNLELGVERLSKALSN